MNGFCPNCGAPRTDGKPFCASCGHALPQGGQPSIGTTPASVPPESGLAKLKGHDLAVLGGGTLLTIAPLFPFLTATAAFVGSISRNGIELTNGEALVLSAVGVIAVVVTLRLLGRRKGLGMILLGLVGLGLTFYYYVQVDERVQEVTDAAVASIGAGIWMAFAGAALVVAGSLASMGTKRAD